MRISSGLDSGQKIVRVPSNQQLLRVRSTGYPAFTQSDKADCRVKRAPTTTSHERNENEIRRRDLPVCRILLLSSPCGRTGARSGRAKSRAHGDVPGIV